VAASTPDSGALSYQWYRNTTATAGSAATILGATSAAYTFTPESTATYYYYVVVTNTIYDNSDGGQKTASSASTAVTFPVNLAFSTTAGLTAWLDGQSGGISAVAPISVALADGAIIGAAGLNTLYDVLDNAGKFVALDLSRLSLTIWPMYTSGHDGGRGKIVELVLPGTLTVISNDNSFNGAFKAFDNLTALTGPNAATTIGDRAFMGLTALATVNLPLATSAGDLVFGACDSLATVNLPNVEIFGANSFTSTPFSNGYSGTVPSGSKRLKAGISNQGGLPGNLWACYDTVNAKAGGTYERLTGGAWSYTPCLKVGGGRGHLKAKVIRCSLDKIRENKETIDRLFTRLFTRPFTYLTLERG
jgi:hypothetical protein